VGSEDDLAVGYGSKPRSGEGEESGSKDRIAGYGESDMARRYLNAS